MKNVYIYCEGQTEESFVNEILYPYFYGCNIFVIPIICETKRTPIKKYKGGITDYQKVRKELIMLSKQHHNELVTTMIDYYAMPADTPGIDNDEPDVMKRIKEIEESIDRDIGCENCRFHFMLHEFEALLFSEPDAFEVIADDNVVKSIQIIRDENKTPEHIDRFPETAPSKRIEALIPTYSKVRNGTLIAKEIGIDVMLEECEHFREWIQWIRRMGEQ